MRKLGQYVLISSLLINSFSPLTALAAEKEEQNNNTSISVVETEEAKEETVQGTEEKQEGEKEEPSEEIPLSDDKNIPFIDLASLKISKKEAALGEKVIYSLKLSEEVEVESMKLQLLHPETNSWQFLDFTYNENDETFRAVLDVTNQVQSGNWKISLIQILEKGSMAYIIYNTEVPKDNSYLNEWGADLSNGDLAIKGTDPDTQLPELHKETVSVSETTAFVGSKIKYSIKMTDNRGITKANVVLYHEEKDENKEIELHYNKVTDRYEGYFEVTEETEKGRWQIRYFLGEDAVGNQGYLQNTQLYPREHIGWNLHSYDVSIEEKEERKDLSVVYQSHVQSYGWQEVRKDGETSGTVDKAKRLEGLKISLENSPYEGSIEYQTHVQSYGWMAWQKNGELSGTEKEAKRLEALRVKLTGDIANYYDIYYRVHAQSYGWLDWTKNGEAAGTEGLSKRLEAAELVLVKKGGAAPGKTESPFVSNKPTISYATHVQKEGWQEYVQNGSMSGTEGKGLRLEALKMNVSDPLYSGGIEYRTHVQKEGWQKWKKNDELSGTEGNGLRLEAVEIRLTGELAKYYDVYYRVHAQSFGWLGWTKNGQSSGTEGLAKRLEGIEVVLVKKGSAAPGEVTRPYIKSKPIIDYATHVQKFGWQKTVSNGAMSGTSGKGLRLEAILINLYDPSLSGTVQYRTHVQKEGWQDWKEDWQMSGTQGKGLRLEAVEIRLTEEMAKYYDIYYRVHAQSYGWLGWAKNGESAGTEGLAKRLEGIEVRLVLKGNPAPGNTRNSFVKKQ